MENTSHSAIRPVWAIGLMSGTSLDGLDAALLRTDGETITEIGPWLSVPFDGKLGAALHEAVRQQGDMPAIEQEFTRQNITVVKRLLDKAGMKPEEVAVIGFHGQTVLHRPQERKTWQIGDAALMAEQTGIGAVADFRRADVEAGGQGAPLVPLFHAAMTREMAHPLVVLNIGGIANVTWIGEGRENLLAFDTGPGNVLLNEWVLRHSGRHYDENGMLAAAGEVNHELLAALLSQSYFEAAPPKSLDRHDFTLDALESLSPEDGAATLVAFTVEAVEQAQRHFPELPGRWLVSGGGRHNPVLMSRLRERLSGEVMPVEAVGWAGDAVEAQAFAYLAVRSLRKLPLTLPSTTGVSCAVTGGVFYPGVHGGHPLHC